MKKLLLIVLVMVFVLGTLSITTNAATTTYEAESSSNNLDGVTTNDDRDEASGSFVGFLGSGNTLQFNQIDVSKTGTYEIDIYYFCGETRDLFISAMEGWL